MTRCATMTSRMHHRHYSDFDAADDGTTWLSSVMGLRGDIASGDERPLYLAWLLGVQYGEIDDHAVEPGRPERLDDLSPALTSFVDIMGLDGDLVAAAAEGCSDVPALPSSQDIERWLSRLSSDDHVAVALLVHLRDVSGRKERDAAFMQRIGALREAHAKKPSLLARLKKAGM